MSDYLDPRNHKTLVLEGYEFESLADVPREKIKAFNVLMDLVHETCDDLLEAVCKRALALHVGESGKGRRLVAQVAVQDESLRVSDAASRERATVDI